MSAHFTHSEMVLDGTVWIEKAAYDAVKAKLDEKHRTQKSHNHQFAAINDCFDSLPMCHAGAPYAASKSAFRKHGLIATGHCEVSTIDCETHDVALRVAPVVAREARGHHGYALTVVRGSLVVCSTPLSQSFKAMGKDMFHKSKADVLAWAEALLGVQR